MSLFSTALDLLAQPLKLRRRHRPRRDPAEPRILVIRRNRMGDMIYTLPLLHILRRHFPKARIVVACDPLGEPIARACPAVDVVVVLQPGWNPWQAVLKNAARLQDYDWVIAAKGGFDRRLALLARSTNAAVRIGFARRADRPSAYYTHPVPLPGGPNEEHQIDTLLRLLKPLGVVKPATFTADLSLRVPDSSREFAGEVLHHSTFASCSRFMLINLSSTAPLKFREEDFIELARRVVGSTDLAIGLVAAPAGQRLAQEIAACMGSKRIIAVDTPEPLDLAALLERAALLVTPEGGAAHLAAAVDTPALVLWSEGPFKKWHSRGRNHAFVHAEPGEDNIPVDRVWQALQPFLTLKKNDVEKKWADLLGLPPSPDFM
ncbi:MAG TPA: glycosyltransferase family 9 protein [Candidatus Methylacidiphilales bacterium]|jgi:heptosyltransferase I|nr:glycosyltransferase family 9 protein [Candidatus Methylacidiphilales bacterium]